jgi:protein associated with RNAse G/E
MSMQVGDRVCVRVYKADGRCYRWLWATVEAVAADELVVVTPPGHRVEDVDGGWVSKTALRAYYWPGRWYCLLEVYAVDGRLEEIYVNINSPVEVENGVVRFTDYELDVSRRPPQGARIVDEEEFREAAAAYGYSEEFQRACYRAAREAVAVADGWVAAGMPA